MLMHNKNKSTFVVFFAFYIRRYTGYFGTAHINILFKNSVKVAYVIFVCFIWLINLINQIRCLYPPLKRTDERNKRIKASPRTFFTFARVCDKDNNAQPRGPESVSVFA